MASSACSADADPQTHAPAITAFHAAISDRNRRYITQSGCFRLPSRHLSSHYAMRCTSTSAPRSQRTRSPTQFPITASATGETDSSMVANSRGEPVRAVCITWFSPGNTWTLDPGIAASAGRMTSTYGPAGTMRSRSQRVQVPARVPFSGTSAGHHSTPGERIRVSGVVELPQPSRS